MNRPAGAQSGPSDRGRGRGPGRYCRFRRRRLDARRRLRRTRNALYPANYI